MLRCDQMPLPLTAQAWLSCLKSNVLNPPNRDQTCLNRCVGKPLRAYARYICLLAIAIIGPYGTLYHFFKAVQTRIRACRIQDVQDAQKSKSLAWEHLKAGLEDFGSLQLFNPMYALQPNQYFVQLMSSSLVTVDPVEGLDFGNLVIKPFGGPVAILANDPDLQDMQNQRYRFDMLMHGALQLRDSAGGWPNLGGREVQQVCVDLLKAKKYGKYDILIT